MRISREPLMLFLVWQNFVNDRAERAVALVQDFNKTLARGEEQLQFLLQVVSEHRKIFPDCKKSTLIPKTGL